MTTFITIRASCIQIFSKELPWERRNEFPEIEFSSNWYDLKTHVSYYFILNTLQKLSVKGLERVLLWSEHQWKWRMLKSIATKLVEWSFDFLETKSIWECKPILFVAVKREKMNCNLTRMKTHTGQIYQRQIGFNGSYDVLPIELHRLGINIKVQKSCQ